MTRRGTGAVEDGDGGAGPRLCLAGSGGGHLRQLIDLEPTWSRYDSYMVTEDSALGRSMAERVPVDFVAHYTLGQARIGRPLRMIGGALKNLVQSFRSVAARRPDMVVTTGAAAMFWTVVFARLRGARIVYVESFARFEHPSKFGRVVRHLADDVVIQSPGLARHWPEARLFDPFRLLEGEAPPKRELIFATVGATLPFPRMTDAIVALKTGGALPEELVVQTGDGGLLPARADGLRQFEALPYSEIRALLAEAKIVVTHGGTGSLITALQAGCRVVAVPRSLRLREIYDGHQEQIVAAFVARGLIERVDDIAELPAALARARARTPRLATTDASALAAWLDGELQAMTRA